jgi:peptidyl-prolyl cis-trans isomerase D
MRNDFKKYAWTLWLVIIAFIGGFIISPSFSGKSAANTELIYIDNEVAIRGEDYQQQLMDTLQRYKDQFKNNFDKSMISQLGLPGQILREMITMVIVLKEAEKLHIKVSDDELNRKILTFPAFQQDGKFIGRARYVQFLRRQHIDVKNFEKQIKNQIVGEKLQSLVTGPLVIDDQALEEKYRKEKDKAELDMITLNTERIKTDITVTDNELTDYYEKNKEEFKSQEKRAAYAIVFNFDDFKKEVHISPKEIYENFKTNMADFRIPGKVKVSRIFLKYGETDRDEVYKQALALQKELTKENFAEKAKAFSQDDKATEGGDWGYMGWKNFTKQEVTMIEALEEQQISSPIDTQAGFAIVYVPEKVVERQQVFNEVQDKIKDTLEQERVKKLVTEKLQSIYDKLGETEDIKAKAREMGVNVIETGLLASGQPVKDIDPMGYISRKMFELKEKEIAFPVQLAKGIALVQLTKIQEPTVEPFAELKDMVSDEVLMAKKVELLKQDAAAISAQLNQMNDEKKIEEFLKKENLTPTAITYNRGNRLSRFPLKKGLDDQVFSLEENRFSSPLAFDDQVVILKLKSKTLTLTADFEKDKAEFYSTQITQLRNNCFKSYIDNKMSTYQVTSNQKLFDKINESVLSRFN